MKMNKKVEISCSTCGGSINIEEGQVLVICPICGNRFSIIKESPDFVIEGNVLVKYCGESREVEVPHGIKVIGIQAFNQQSTLTKVPFPEGVTELQGTFFNCYNLEEIILPDSLEHIPDLAFCSCMSLKEIVLPPNLKSLGSLAFYDCKSLISIEIPPTVKSIEMTTFYNCESLETVSYYKQTKIEGDCFGDCDSLISLNLLDNETKEIISKKKIIKLENGFFKIENGFDESTIVLPLPTEEVLNKYEKSWQVTLPDSYKEFIKKLNGVRPKYAKVKYDFRDKRGIYSYDEEEIERFFCIDNGTEFDIDVVMNSLEEMWTYDEYSDEVQILPIAKMVGGNFLALNYKNTESEPTVCVWDNEESEEFDPITYFVANSFREFMKMLK